MKYPILFIIMMTIIAIAPEALSLCYLDSDCPSPLSPRCYLTSCVGCVSSIISLLDNCIRFAATPLCNTATGACVQCLSDSDCSSTAAVECSTTNTCVPCTHSSQCSTRFPLTPFCKDPGASGTCVQCITDTDCPTTTLAKCSATTNTCVSCTENDHCTRFTATPLCNTATGICVECLANENCTSIVTPQCSATNTCILCGADSHCTRFPSTPACSPALGGVCAACVLNSHCSSQAAAQCLSHTCVPCTNNLHCVHFTSAPLCKTATGTCVQCLSDSDCSSTAAAKCSSNNTCVPCTDSIQCSSHFPLMPVCKSPGASGTCVKCVNDADCSTITAAQCSTTTNTCVPCTNNTHCTHFTATPLCNTATGICVKCLAHADCTSITNPQCLANTCILCGADSHCTRFPSTPACSPALGGACAACVLDSHCPLPTAPKCTGYTCVPCSDSSQCSSRFPSTPVCKSPGASGTCVQCVNDANCPTATAAQCSTTTNTCVPCTNNTHCTRFTATPLCNTATGICVECLANENCASIESAKCSTSNTCTTCTLDIQCARFPSTPICNVALGGKCIPCYIDSHCPSPTAAKCTDYTCVACTSNSQCSRFDPKSKCSSGKCVECLNDAHCTGGKVCSSSGVCSICLSSSECATSLSPICNTELGLCTECQYDTHCNSDPTRSQCSTSGSCIPCTESIHCEHFPSIPICSGGVCVQCVADSDCPNAGQAKCSDNICLGCTDSSQCAHLSLTPVCNAATGACVECIADTDCPSTPASICSSTSNTCVPCYQYLNSCYLSCPDGTSTDSTDFTCITACTSSSDCLAAADIAHPECNGTMCVACSSDIDCQEWHNQIEINCAITSGVCVSVVDPVIETIGAVASTITASAAVAVSGAAAISTFASAGSASRGFSTLRITKLAALVRYINIVAPYQAEKLFEGFTKAQTFIRTMLVGMFDSEQYNQTMSNLPKRFIKFEDSSLFLKNAGMTVLIGVLVGLAVIMCRVGMHQAHKKRSRAWMKRLLNIQKIIEWNYILGTVAGSYSDLVLGFGLQTYDHPLSNPTPLSLFSFVICVFVAPIATLFPLLCLFLMSAPKKSRSRKSHNITRYEVLITDFKENNSDTKIYQVLGLLRIQAMVFPLIFWQDNPLAQVIFMIVGSIAVNLFHVTKVKYKSKFTNFVILTNEVLFFISLIGVLLNIAFVTAGINPNDSSAVSAAGWIITLSLTFLMIFNAIITIIGLLKYIWKGFKEARNRSKPNTRQAPRSKPYLRSVRRPSPAANDPALNLSQRNQALSGSRIDIDIQTTRRTKRRFERI